MSQPQASAETGVVEEDSAEQKPASTRQRNAPNLPDSTHSHDHLDKSIVQVAVDPCLLKKASRTAGTTTVHNV